MGAEVAQDPLKQVDLKEIAVLKEELEDCSGQNGSLSVALMS